MKERPIIFDTWAISKIQDGSKTQTRRLRNLEKINESPNDWVYQGNNLVDNHYYFYHRDYVGHKSGDAQMITIHCPYGQVGDVLYIKETWMIEMHSGCYDIKYKDGKLKDAGSNLYIAAYSHLRNRCGVWRPSIFMPRWASRIMLEITEVRAERLQEISEMDAIAEGCNPVNKEWDNSNRSATFSFHTLWDSINGKKYPWDNNDWVFPISFKKVQGE